MRGQQHEGTVAVGDALRLGEHVAYVVPRVAVEALLEALLVEVVPDEAHRAPQHKEAVEAPAAIARLRPRFLRDFSTGAPNVKQTRENLFANATRWKTYIPSISWYGSKNQYHLWLLGNEIFTLNQNLLGE